MDDGRVYFARDKSRWLGNVLILFIGICQWVYAFILSTYVVMSGSVEFNPGTDRVEVLSPDLMDFSTRATALRSSCFLALLALTWAGVYSFLWRRRWAWYYTWALGISLLAIGLYVHASDENAIENTTGLVVAVLAGTTLVLLPLPHLRRQFFDGSRLSFREC